MSANKAQLQISRKLGKAFPREMGAPPAA